MCVIVLSGSEGLGWTLVVYSSILSDCPIDWSGLSIPVLFCPDASPDCPLRL